MRTHMDAGRKHKRVAIVAGVGPGLGAALVRKLFHEGCRVGMFARSRELIGKLAAELGADAVAVRTDVADAKQVAAGFRKVREKLGPVEILIAHASGSVGEGLMKTTPDQFEQSWRVAVLGAFLCAREAVPDMLRNEGAQLFSPAPLLRCAGAAVRFHLVAQSSRCADWHDRLPSNCGQKVFMWHLSSSIA